MQGLVTRSIPTLKAQQSLPCLPSVIPGFRRPNIGINHVPYAIHSVNVLRSTPALPTTAESCRCSLILHDSLLNIGIWALYSHSLLQIRPREYCASSCVNCRTHKELGSQMSTDSKISSAIYCIFLDYYAELSVALESFQLLVLKSYSGKFNLLNIGNTRQDE